MNTVNKELIEENLKETKRYTEESKKSIEELNTQILLLNTQLTAQLEENKNTLRNEITKKQEHIATKTELHELRKKLNELDAIQSNLRTRILYLEDDIKSNKQVEMKQLIDASEKIRIESSIILRENQEIKRVIETSKQDLTNEVQRLRNENEFLLREHERIYERNREFEGILIQLRKDYKYRDEKSLPLYKRIPDIFNRNLTSIRNSKATPKTSADLLLTLQEAQEIPKQYNYVTKFRNICNNLKINNPLNKTYDGPGTTKRKLKLCLNDIYKNNA